MFITYVYKHVCILLKVPLGVQLKNEIYLTEMCDVLDSFTKYVPMEVCTDSMEIKGNTYTYDNSKMVQLLLFGDQLTVARARGASMLRDAQVGKKDTLKAYVPTISDWHTRICLLEVRNLFVCFLFMCTHSPFYRSYGKHSFPKNL